MQIEIPQDILKRESKIMGNFSARQIICLGIGIGLGILVAVAMGDGFEIKTRITVGAIAAMPALVIGFKKIYDQPIEKMLPVIIEDNFLLPAKRVYKQENLIEEEDLKRLEFEKNGGKKEKKVHQAAPSKQIKGIK